MMTSMGYGQWRELPPMLVRGLVLSLAVSLGFSVAAQPLSMPSRTGIAAILTAEAAAKPVRTTGMPIGDVAVPAWLAAALGERAAVVDGGVPLLRQFDGLGLAVRPMNGKDRQVRDDVSRWLAAAIADARQTGVRADAGDDNDPLLAVLRQRADAFRPGSPAWPSIRAIRYAPGAAVGELHFEVALIGSAITAATLDVAGFAASAASAEARPLTESPGIVPLMP